MKIKIIFCLISFFSLNAKAQKSIQYGDRNPYGIIVIPNAINLITALDEYKNNYYDFTKKLTLIGFTLDSDYLEGVNSYGKFIFDKCNEMQSLYMNFEKKGDFFQYNIMQYKNNCTAPQSLLFDTLKEQLKTVPMYAEGPTLNFHVVYNGIKYTITIEKRDDHKGLMEFATIYYGHK
jgi:hypothetical protein